MSDFAASSGQQPGATFIGASAGALVQRARDALFDEHADTAAHSGDGVGDGGADDEPAPEAWFELGSPRRHIVAWWCVGGVDSMFCVMGQNPQEQTRDGGVLWARARVDVMFPDSPFGRLMWTLRGHDRVYAQVLWYANSRVLVLQPYACDSRYAAGRSVHVLRIGRHHNDAVQHVRLSRVCAPYPEKRSWLTRSGCAPDRVPVPVASETGPGVFRMSTRVPGMGDVTLESRLILYMAHPVAAATDDDGPGSSDSALDHFVVLRYASALVNFVGLGADDSMLPQQRALVDLEVLLNAHTRELLAFKGRTVPHEFEVRMARAPGPTGTPSLSLSYDGWDAPNTTAAADQQFCEDVDRRIERGESEESARRHAQTCLAARQPQIAGRALGIVDDIETLARYNWEELKDHIASLFTRVGHQTLRDKLRRLRYRADIARLHLAESAKREEIDAKVDVAELL